LFSQLFRIVQILSDIFKINVEGILAVERKSDSPVAANADTPGARAVTFQPMQPLARQVQICGATSAVKHVQLSAQTVGKVG
jgi:hypothetical protein